MSLYLNKYVKETGLVLGPNYYPEMPQDDGIHGYTAVMPTQSYVKDHFNEQTELYYEGATQQEIVDYYTPILMKRGIEIFVHLIQRAKASSMEKKLDKDYQDCLEVVYKLKHLVVSNQIERQYVKDLLIHEATNDFPIVLDYPTYCGMVENRWNDGELKYDKFIAMAERFRSGLLTALERQDIERAKQIIAYGESVPEVVTMQELEALTSDLLVLTTRPS